MKKLLGNLSTALTILLGIVLPFVVPYRAEWMFVEQTLWIASVYALFSIWTRRQVFSVVGDWFMMGGLLLLVCYAQSALLLWLLAIPLSDLLVGVRCRKAASEEGDAQHGFSRASYAVAVVLALALFVPMSVSVWQRTTVLGILALILALLCLSFALVQMSGRLRAVAVAERQMPYTAYAVPMAMATWMIGEDVPTGLLVECFSMALLVALLVTACEKTWRGQASADRKAIHETALYQELAALVKKGEKMSDDQVASLAGVVRDVFPSYPSQMLGFQKMNELETLVCLLLKADFSFAEISVLTCRSIDTIYSVCRRLYHKNFHEEGTSKKWKAVIQRDVRADGQGRG